MICYFIFVLSNHIKQTFFGQKTPKQDPPPKKKKKKSSVGFKPLCCTDS